jgi:hypothetical protein
VTDDDDDDDDDGDDGKSDDHDGDCACFLLLYQLCSSLHKLTHYHDDLYD